MKDRAVAIKMMKEYCVAMKNGHQEQFFSLWDSAGKQLAMNHLLTRFGLREDSRTERFRLKTFLNGIGYDKHDIPIDGISLEIIVNSKPFKTSDPDLTMAVFEALNKIHELPMEKPAHRPRSQRTIILACFKPLAKFLFENKLVVDKGTPSKNKIAKLVEGVLREAGIDNISLPQITKGIF